MARNTQKAQTWNLYVGPSPATGAHAPGSIKQIHRLISAPSSWSHEKDPISVIGQAAPITRDTSNPPTATIDSLQYYLVDMVNEQNLGFAVNTGTNCLVNILAGTQDEKNYFYLNVPPGQDAIGLGGPDGKVMGFGNGSISSYEFTAAVGDYPNVTVSVDAKNIETYDDGVAKPIPAINTTNGTPVVGVNFTIPTGTLGESGKPFVLKHGDVTVDLTNASPLFMEGANLCPQSVSLSIPISREDQNCLGSKFARVRDITFPIDVDFSMEIIGNELKSDQSLVKFLCDTGKYTAIITLRRPVCSGTGVIAAQYEIRGMERVGDNIDLTANENMTSTVNFRASIGGSGDLANGVFFTGTTSY